MLTVRSWLIVFSLGFAVTIAIAQPEAEAPSDPPSIQSIVERRDTLLDSQEVARGLYSEAIERLRRAQASGDAASAFRTEIADAPVKLESIREELLRPATQTVPQPPADASLTQLEQAEAEAAAALAAARAIEGQLQAETTTRQSRRTQIQDELPLKRQELALVEETLRSSPAEDADATLIDARRTALVAKRFELLATIEELDSERASYDARRDLLPARRDLAARRVSKAEELARAWRQLVSERRQREAERSAREAERLRQETARQHPVLQAYAAETQRLAEQRTKPDAIPQRIDVASSELAEARSGFVALRQRYTAVKQRIDASGLDRATGLMLRREFETLPDVAALNKRASRVDQDLGEIEFLLFARRDLRIGSDDINQVRQQLMSELNTDVRAQPGLEAVATELVTARRDLLAELESDADRYQDILVDLDRESESVLEAALEYESFIRERILWVQSIPASGDDLVDGLGASRTWLFDADEWALGWSRTRDDIFERYPSTLFAFALIALVVAGSRWSKRRIIDIAVLVSRYRTDGFGHTVAVLFHTLLWSAPIPVFLWLAGWVLTRPVEQVPIALSFGFALQTAAHVLLVLLFTRYSLRPSGLMDAHFKWPDRATTHIRKQLRWYVPSLTTCVIIVSVATDRVEDSVIASTGRIWFTIGMLASSVVIARVLRPSGPIRRELLRQRESGWLDRLKYVWFPVLIALPIGVAILAWLGYFYTAIQLEQKMETTVAMSLALVIVNSLLLRWLFLARRRVSVEEARRRREQAIASEASGQTTPDSGPTESSIPPIDEDKLDLPSISLQTKQLFSAAIWVSAVVSVFAIWADVLPALRMLDRIEIYPEQRLFESATDDRIEILETQSLARSSTAQTTSPDGVQATRASSSSHTSPLPIPSTQATDAAADSAPSVSVTIADIGLAMLIAIATIVAFRNLPGLIEIVVLQRLPLDAGSRYALSTVLKYSITVIGVVAASSALEIAWSNVQWLAAALTFGLAFGLQEIFANFISGLIILAERPIRIGDTVTVGNVNGTVTRIRMRATTITDWDRKELVIPNKTFITDDVINWTLSDPTLRVIIPVGVSYGADVRSVETLLMQLAN